jgi:excisionase family DNA binding protein
LQNIVSTTVPTRRHELAALLTVSEVAELLGVSTKKVYRLIRSGELPALRLGLRKGAAVRIERDELLAWLRSEPGEAAQPTSRS